MAALVLLAAGCFGGERISEHLAQEAVGRAVGADVDFDAEMGSVRISGEDATFELGGGQHLPDAFPGSFPLPDDAEVISSMRLSDDGQEMLTAMLGTTAELAHASDAFEVDIAATPWVVEGRREMEMGDIRQRHFEVAGEGYRGLVVFMAMGDDQAEHRTTLQITLEPGDNS